jgi:hypothetical protein
MVKTKLSGIGSQNPIKMESSKLMKIACGTLHAANHVLKWLRCSWSEWEMTLPNIRYLFVKYVDECRRC